MRITCEGTRALVEEPTVVADRDGVHVRVTNDTGGTIEMYLAGMPEQVRVEPGVRDLVVPAPPGDELSFSCGTADGAVSGAQVVDPNGYFRPAVLDCEAPAENFGTGDLLALVAAGEDPVAALRADPGSIRGLLPSDELHAAGYPEGAPARLVVVVERGGSDVAALQLEVHEGTWYFVGLEASCDAF
jgi:hypothetical protein